MSIIDSQEPVYREEHEIDVLTRRIAELECMLKHQKIKLVCYGGEVDALVELICDMWEDLVGLQGGYEELGYQTSLPEFAKRMRRLGIEVDE